MNDTHAPEGAHPDDEVLLADLGRILDLVDQPPAGLVQRVQFALELENLDVEVAQWERAGRLTGVRSSVDQGTITFTVSDLTIMINLTKTGLCHRIDGWLVPAGEHDVEVRVAGYGSTSTTADEGGRFVLDEIPRGTTQIVISVAGAGNRTVVTPAVVL
ncbi:MAG TPA: carboxypeptidase regulatory-like domain-containing protein [Amycolatopsis sp.]|uniref:carboxypeptidase regulatory-like domain-containing protein n=1 Tax=Amycolatopsis sp. TaxID=37632 RepID=UPI002B471D9A|nr:carboxypeptidase regulatory-like domain-containing protein [Amycolatopsis sp.]HKS44621.1 carboxypeptidase regulatory-like domain-containing protein [Amycolatopsis sp.]